MPESSRSPRPEFRIFWSILRADLWLAGGLFLTGFGIFLAFTLPMDNQFAAYARENARMLAVTANLKTLPGYLLLALGYAFLTWPFLRRRHAFIDGERSARARLSRALWLLGANSVVFVASLGLCGLTNGAFLDALTRHLAPLFPGFDFTAFYRWHLIEILGGAFLLLTAWALWDWLGLVPRRVSRSLPARGALALALLSLGVAIAAPGFGGGERTPKDPATRRPHVIVIGSDSLRADHLRCYGYGRETSPNIDALAEEGYLFEQFHVATASTLESWITFLTSKFPQTHGIRYMFPSKERVERASRDPDALPRILGRAGWHTGVSSNWAGNCFNLVDLGFAGNRASDIQNLDVFIAEAALMAHFIYPLYFNNRVGEVLYPQITQFTSYLNPAALHDRFADEMDAALKTGQSFFGVLFQSTTHLPFAATHPYNLMWSDPEYRGPNRFQIDFEVDSFIQAGFREALTPEQVQHIIDLYDGTVSEFDADVGDAIEWLKDEGLYEDAIIIITSDHGDDLYEPGTTLGHGTNFFGGDQSTRIPLVVRLPEWLRALHPEMAPPGHRVRQVVRTVDFAPTLLELLGQDVPPSYEGTSLLPAMQSPEKALDLPAFAETCYLFFPKKVPGEAVKKVAGANATLRIDPDFENNFVLKEKFHQPVIDTKDRMIRTGRWKLIHIPGEHGPILRLFDMQADPSQEHDLSERHPELRERLFSALQAWWAGDVSQRWSEADDEPGR